MIFLLNHERLHLEKLQLARFKIAQALNIKPNTIKIELTPLEDGKVKPQFSVPEVKDKTNEEIETQIRDTYKQVELTFMQRWQDWLEYA